MKRRHFLGSALAAGALNPRAKAADLCDCSFFAQVAATPAGNPGWEPVSSGVKITGMKVYGVSLSSDSDRPYVFVKLETNKGVVGWGEGTLEGKAAAVIACVEDFREFLIGKDPMQVEHHWQSMYVHSFYALVLSSAPPSRHRPGALGYPR
jgi:galactonate dehydratase